MAVQIEMWYVDHVLRKHMKLQIHRNTYEVDGRKVLLLEGHKVCLIEWSIIHRVLKADFYQFKRYSILGMPASHHGNRDAKKGWVATWQACTSLAAMIEGATNLMPHRISCFKIQKKLLRQCS